MLKRLGTQRATYLILFILLVFLPYSPAHAAVMPGYEILPQISGIMTAPSYVASSPDGKIYVIENLNNAVRIYSRKGAAMGSISIEKPTAIAINDSGTIYIGSKKDNSVRIYDSAGADTGRRLGAGANEFLNPQAIAVDGATKNVYVADPGSETIRVYSEAGAYLKAIDDAGNTPRGITIYNNEKYVIDHPLLTGANGLPYRGARINVYGSGDTAVRSIGSYGMDPGQFISPAGISHDASGRIYVTDAYQGVVLCFDGPTGTYLGVVRDTASPMVTPVGIEVGRDGRLLVVSQNTFSVKIFGLEGYTSLGLSPLELNFSASEGTNPSSQALTVSNSGTGTLGYTAAADAGWITLTGSPGTIGAKSSGQLIVGINVAGLAAGAYSGQVVVTDNTGAQEKATVTLGITSAPNLTVTPGALIFAYTPGGAAPDAQGANVQITNDTAGTATWSAAADKGWISITPAAAASSGNSSTAMSISVQPSGLMAGMSYSGKVTVTAAGAKGSPAEIAITLNIGSAGSIEVTTNLAAASFTVTGPITRTGSGTSMIINDVPNGDYTITYQRVAGYKSPQSETKRVNGNAIKFTGTYEDLRHAKNIITSPGDTGENKTMMRIFNPTGTMLKEVPMAGSRAGAYLASGDIDGDGVEDIITGKGPDAKHNGRITVYNRAGTVIADFVAFNTKYGVRVAAGDFDGDGKAEIVAGTGPGMSNDAQVRIFKYEGGVIKDTGVNIIPFSTKYGVTVAVGDVDGDGKPELVVGPGPDINAAGTVRVFKINTAGGLGNWQAVDTGVVITAFGSYGANVAVGDLDGDGREEILAASGSNENVTGSKVIAYRGDGSAYGLEIAAGTAGGLEIAAGDTDMDGLAEIVTAPGPVTTNTALIKIYKNNGTAVASFQAFTNSASGANVCLGDLGY